MPRRSVPHVDRLLVRGRALGACLVAALAGLLLVTGCSGGGGTEDAEVTGAGTAVAESGAAGTGGGETGAVTTVLTVAAVARAIGPELDEALTDLRDVDSLDELREDLNEIVSDVGDWREELAEAPDDPALSEQRKELDEALEELESSLSDLAAKAQKARPAGLGDLARRLTPDNLAAADAVRSALESFDD